MIGINLKNLSFKYENRECKVIENLNLDFHYGTINLITGYSGCGKSTILYLISRIIPDVIDGEITGDIFVNGINTIDKTISNLSRFIGSVIQDPDKQIINDKVSDEIAFGLENLGFSKDKIKANISKYAELLKLDLNKFTRTMSGGEKERLLIASIFAMEQKIILLDEPLANLDQKSIKIVLDNLVNLKKQGYLIIIAEHRLNYLKDIVDNTYILKNKTLEKIDINDYLVDLVNTKEIKKVDYKTNNLLISLKDINYQLKKKKLLNNINLDIYEGEKILLIGDNGIGKTTLLKLLGKIIKPSSGEYKQSLVKKIRANKLGNKEWFRNVGYVFQNPNYQLFMPSVLEELTYSSTDKEYLNYLIDELNLKPLLNIHSQALSEGQKRRVCLAAILAAKPKVLLFDEPTVGQDDDNLSQIIKVVNDYYDRFKPTIISITHDYRYAKNVSNRVILLTKEGLKDISEEELKLYFN